MPYRFAFLFLFFATLFSRNVFAQTTSPELSSWLINTINETGYDGLPANVQSVEYTKDTVYISCSGIPTYTIGPWPGDPNKASDQHYVVEFPRTPTKDTSAKPSPAPLGAIGYWINGVPIFNALDGNTYNNDNTWHNDAVIVEAASFDACNGHPQMNGAYHHHENPVCLYTADAAKHSPLLGYALDGYPVYGPYGYASGTAGAISLLRSSYNLRNITQRTTLPNGTALQSADYGPEVSTTYPLGYYIEDYAYTAGSGDLDGHNGHFTVTPEYPNGTYAYVVTLDSTGASAYPYTIGGTYYGTIPSADLPPNGVVTISDSAVVYTPATGVPEQRIAEPAATALLGNYPNPFSSTTTISFSLPVDESVTSLKVFDQLGKEVADLTNQVNPMGNGTVEFDASNLPAGLYYYWLSAGKLSQDGEMAVIH